jgi:hypothetical protein
MDRGLVDLLGLIAPLVQAIAILSQRLDQQSGTASGLLDKIAEIAKVVSGLPLR